MRNLQRNKKKLIQAKKQISHNPTTNKSKLKTKFQILHKIDHQ